MTSARARRAAIYARVSTRDQQPENQLLELRRFAAAQNLEIVEEFVDHGESGARIYNQPDSAHGRLRAEVRRGLHCRFGHVLVWRFDRFARNARELHNALWEFQQAGIRFVSLREQVDTESISGKLLFSVLAGIAEMELGIMSERIRAGIARARAAGAPIGRPRALDRVKIEAAYEMRLAGASWRNIARRFGVAHASVREAVLDFAAKRKGII